MDNQAKISVEPHFELIKHRNGSCVYADERNGIAKIAWSQVVDEHTAKEMIHALANLMKSGLFPKILMTRDDSTFITEEANIWMRDFLLTNRYKFNYKLSRIAGVTSDVYRANLFGNFIKTALQVIFPGIKITNFEYEESALAWLV